MLSLESIGFLLIGVLLVGYAVLDGFDLGVGILHLLVAQDDRERRVFLNSIGPVWDGNEVWLLTAGGALFAAFPRAYATVFSGFYLAFMLLLAALIVRAVSVEARSKVEARLWRRCFDAAFWFGSTLAALLFGVAVGNLVRGLPLDAAGEFRGTFLSLLNPFALLVGLLSVAMCAMQGAAWLGLKTDRALRVRALRAGRSGWIAFVGLWLLSTIASRFVAPQTWHAYSHPLAWIAPIAALSSALLVPVHWARQRFRSAFFSSSIAIAGLLGIVGQGLYPYLVPALGEAAGGLSVANASSSPLTLKAMLIIALLGMPLVVAYQVYIYGRFKGPVALDENSY